MKVGIIGTGRVGASIAISALQGGIARELVLCDLRSELAEGEARDLAHGAAFYPEARVSTGDVEDMRDCDAVVIAAGRNGRADEPRIALLQDNAPIIRGLAKRLAGMRGALIIVTNPVDVLTQIAFESAGLPEARVIGTGTMLDTARLRHALAGTLDVAPTSIHAQVVGEHGDSEVPLWSSAQVGGVSLRSWRGWRQTRELEIAAEVRHAAYEIIARKGATNHAIGLTTASLLRCILRDERRVLTVSRSQTGAFGVEGLALSLPTIVGRDGATEVLEPELSSLERVELMTSANMLEGARATFERRSAEHAVCTVGSSTGAEH